MSDLIDGEIATPAPPAAGPPRDAAIGPAPRRARIGLRALLIVGALLLVAAGAVLRATAPEPIPIESAPDVGIPTQTLTLALAPRAHRVQVSGIVAARRDVELFAEQSGHVIEVGAESLDSVAADQLLLRIDPLPGEVEVAQAEASLAQAKSELDLARAELGRSRELATNRVSSASDLDRKQNAERVAAALYRAAEASLRSARDRLAKRTLHAPFAGVLRAFDARVGEFVSPGERVGELLDVSHVRVTVGVRDVDVVAVRAGMHARVRVDARPDEVHDATVVRVGAAADTSSRKFPVQLEIANPDGLLMPGMVAVVDLDLGTSAQSLLVPRDAVLDEFGLKFVYVVDADHEQPVVRHRRVEIRSVPFEPGTLEVIAGLQSGDQIATTGLRQLRDGARIQPRGALAAPPSGAP